MIIDVFNHVNTKEFSAKMFGPGFPNAGKGISGDPEERIREMQRFPGLVQVLTQATNASLEDVTASRDEALSLARTGNDEMAEWTVKYPDYFISAAAVLPSQIDDAISESVRCIEQLNFKGICIGTRIDDKELGSEEFFPLYELLAGYDLPIWLHPCDGPHAAPDGGAFQWPLETAWAMISLACSGVFERYPGIKFITHHCGGLLTYLSERLYLAYFKNRMYRNADVQPDYDLYFNNLKKFYNDTALYGVSTPSIMVGYDFFGADHILFGTDFPLDGSRLHPTVGQTENTIKMIENMAIPQEEKEKIYSVNAIKLLNLPYSEGKR